MIINHSVSTLMGWEKKSIRSSAQICYIHKKVTLLKFFLVILSGEKLKHTKNKKLVRYDNGDISPAIHKIQVQGKNSQ